MKAKNKLTREAKQKGGFGWKNWRKWIKALRGGGEQCPTCRTQAAGLPTPGYSHAPARATLRGGGE